MTARYQFRDCRPLAKGGFHEIVVIGEVVFENHHRVECKVVETVSDDRPEMGQEVHGFGFVKALLSRNPNIKKLEG